MTEVRSYPAGRFPMELLLAHKADHVVSVCIPARNEETTVGTIVEVVREHLAGPVTPLVDEILVVDDRSTDRTAEVARSEGARVVDVGEVLPEAGPGSGKGNVLWKSVAACDGDLIVWIDADLTSFAPCCVTGLVGPLLCDPAVAMVKGYFERPETGGTGGGRPWRSFTPPSTGQGSRGRRTGVACSSTPIWHRSRHKSTSVHRCARSQAASRGGPRRGRDRLRDPPSTTRG